MVSEVEFDKIFNYWWEDLKWSGIFRINWMFIRDVHHADVQDLKTNSTPVPQLKDGSRVDFETGKKLLEAFKHTDVDSDIFEAFEYMDEREEKLRIKRDSYYEMIKQLKLKGFIPESFKNHHPYRGHKYNNYNKKRPHFKTRGYKNYHNKESNGNYRYYVNKQEEGGSEYIKKDEFK